MKRCSSHDGINGKLNWCLAIIVFSSLVFLPIAGWMVKTVHDSSVKIAVISSYFEVDTVDNDYSDKRNVFNVLKTNEVN